VGVALFVIFSAVSYWRLSGRVLRGRLVLMAVMGGLLALVAQLHPVWPLVVVAATLALLLVVEGTRSDADPRERATEPRVSQLTATRR
jgi:hypothetical protein